MKYNVTLLVSSNNHCRKSRFVAKNNELCAISNENPWFFLLKKKKITKEISEVKKIIISFDIMCKRDISCMKYKRRSWVQLFSLTSWNHLSRNYVKSRHFITLFSFIWDENYVNILRYQNKWSNLFDKLFRNCFSSS